MGIADQVAELEDEVQDAHERLRASQQEATMLENQVTDLKAELEEERGFVDWVETNYPDARETYNALIKVKGEQL
jgi:predicted  nucleic acid-binding Zn-ribbon protein